MRFKELSFILHRLFIKENIGKSCTVIRLHEKIPVDRRSLQLGGNKKIKKWLNWKVEENWLRIRYRPVRLVEHASQLNHQTN